MSMPVETPVKRRTPRGVKIVLALSLTLNLLIFGAIGGAFLGGRGEDGQQNRADTARLLGLGPLAFALERDDRAAVMRGAGANQEMMRRQRRQLVEAARGFAQAVRGDPFDRAAAEAALEVQRGTVVNLQDRGSGALLDHLATMSPAARDDFADNLLQILNRRGRR
jgi:uncharacterized membrane protein